MNREVAAEFASIGAHRFPAVLGADDLGRVVELFGHTIGAGRRLTKESLQDVSDLLRPTGAIGAVAIELLGPAARPVRALFLDKSETANWRLGWHQDRTIAVKERVDVEGFGPWSVKAGQLHVQPPHCVTETMITLRVHLDAVDETNAPLDIVPGSHVLGRLSNDDVEGLVRNARSMRCLAEAGDVWAYGTSIVHASSEQMKPGRRRILQLDYTADELPHGLKWAELV